MFIVCSERTDFFFYGKELRNTNPELGKED